jgi:hypothetical protein
MPIFKRACVVLLLIVASACGGGSSTPTAPTPPPTPAANIVQSGQFAFSCTTPSPYDPAMISNCTIAGALQNTGAGCAANTTAVVRLSGTAGTLPDMQLGAVGVGLSARVLRPGEVVSVGTIQSISHSAANAVTTYQIVPTWTNVAC